MASPLPTLDRRSLVKGGMWSAPVLLATTAVPAYAASPVVTDQYTADAGVFAQVFAQNIGQDYATPGTNHIGVSSYEGSTTRLDGTENYADGAPTATTGFVSSGAGTFTPGGSVTDAGGQYGGVGFWISAPKVEGGDFVAGYTTLVAGATFRVSYTVTFETPEDVIEPYGWSEVRPTNTKVLDDSGTTVLRESLNDAQYQVQPGASGINGNTWTGTADITINPNATPAMTATGTDTPYAQVLFSNFPIYYDFIDTISSFSVTVTAVSAHLEVNADGDTQAPRTIDISGQSATATLNLAAATTP